MIVVTGCTGFLGRRICKLLDTQGKSYIGVSRRNTFDLRDAIATKEFFLAHDITKIIHCAAHVGGIQYGMKYPGEIFRDNMQMMINLLEVAHIFKIRRLVNPISNCAYPASARLFKEDEFWNGPLHESVMVYGFVRKASWVGAWAYANQYKIDVINLILSNLYGPEDHFEEERSHALGALIMKIVRAKMTGEPQVKVWGSGKPVREWLHVDDAAEAMVRALEVSPSVNPINIGVGKGISILDLAELIREVAAYEGELVFDLSKPDGAQYKTVDGSRGFRHFNWGPSKRFREGVEETVRWYIQNQYKNV
jgi:GDP-L-fucose synthase